METTSIIQVTHLCKYYPLYVRKRDRMLEALDPRRRSRHTLFKALDDVSFTVMRGESVGIIGVNGSGKSTLLKVLSGILTPTSGKVEVGGRVSALLELGAGFHPERTGIDNVLFQGSMMGLSKKESKAYLSQVIEFAEIGDFVRQPVKMYSSGMYVRLAFAAAIQGKPDILIVDEAMAVGDIAFQFKCMSKMKSLMEEGMTVLFVSHDTAAVKSLCQRCVYLSQGKVKAIGNAAEIGDMYLRDQRGSMNSQTETVCPSGLDREAALPTVTDVSVAFRRDADFASRVAPTRQGSGDVHFTCVEILDANGAPLAQAEFDQLVTIRLHMEFFKDGVAHAGYHIRNRLNEEILGSGTGLENFPPLSGKAGACFVVDFTTRVPLRDGPYSVYAVSTTKLGDNTWRFNDMVENAIQFSVSPRTPIQIWNAVQLPNTVAIYNATQKKYFCPLCAQSHTGYLPIWKELAEQLTQYGFDAEALDMEFYNRQNLSCPICGGIDRERLSAEYLLRRLKKGFVNPEFRFLEFAPNPAFSTFVQREFCLQHKTADLLRPGVDYHLDITNMPEIATESIDAWISLHMLEHIPDDRRALRELYRILKPGGFGLLLVPISLSLEKVDEDPLASVEERWRRFGQDDHIRTYSKKDFVERVETTGFKLSQLGKSWFGAECFDALGLPDKAVLYVAEKGSSEAML